MPYRATALNLSDWGNQIFSFSLLLFRLSPFLRLSVYSIPRLLFFLAPLMAVYFVSLAIPPSFLAFSLCCTLCLSLSFSLPVSFSLVWSPSWVLSPFSSPETHIYPYPPSVSQSAQRSTGASFGLVVAYSPALTDGCSWGAAGKRRNWTVCVCVFYVWVGVCIISMCFWAVSVCVCMCECVYVCVGVRWSVGVFVCVPAYGMLAIYAYACLEFLNKPFSHGT